MTHGADLRIEPALAVRWETPEENFWSFELRPGVTFHDGTRLSPERVVEGLERVRTDAASPARSWLASVESIRAVPPSRVLVRTRWPDPLLLHHLAQIPIALGRSASEVTAHPAGTGPYRVVRLSAEGLAVEAFSGWWGKPPEVRRARFLAIPEGDGTVAALRSGRVDVATVPLAIAGPAAFPFPVEEMRGLTTMFLWINSRSRPSENRLADVRVRRALALALDRRLLAERATGRADAAARQLIPATMFGYQPDLPPPATDTGAARRLLAAAGHEGGFPVELAFRETPLARRAAEAVAAQLAVVGVRALLRPVGYEESLRPYRDGARGLFLDPWTFDVPDASSFLFDCIGTRDLASGRGLLNPGFSSPRLDALIDRGSALVDAPARLEAIREALLLAEQEVPAVPLFEVTRVWGHAPDVVYRPRVDGRIELTGISYRAAPAR